MPIKGYGAMDITMRPSDNETRIVTLANIAYVSTFHTNTILFRCFEEAGGYWDTRATPQCLMHGGKPFAITEKQYEQYVVEYNPIASRTTGATFPTDSAMPRSIARATTDIWHLRIGHLHNEALQKLPEVTDGVELSCTSLSHCKTCHTAKAHQIISRCPQERVTTPLTYLHLDLIQLQPAYNRDEWALHFLDDCSRMNYIYTLAAKSQLTEAIKGFAAFIKRQYNINVRTI